MQAQPQQLLYAGTVIGSDGETVGAIGQVYLDDRTGDVSWVTVKTGWFGSKESFVPTDEATVSGDSVTVPYDKATIKDAPHSSDAGETLSPGQENDLYTHYRVGTGHLASDTEHAVSDHAATTAVAGTTAADAGDVLTRSEERLCVGTPTQEAGRARLRKFVVTEQETVTVPVSHEEVRVIRETLAPGDAVDGSTIGEASVEVTLHEGRVVVDKDVVAVEKVLLDTETVTEQQRVTEQVRKEQIDTGEVVTAAPVASEGRTQR
ncbi:PRC and DUF2382 domain-containing protein [Nakamurella leprariae]|uniref:PRC and DUF2382 domain-containing protein n=1 Tax=Nakamurella leprariae TaxID=2803911 RepID=A0A938YCJ1_9ACTN|nr:PRC and DUF2382 domain-containing protein [Nakamurella leprariae]MBM9467091.1 PRC and DUF2382 domain-containing protein [Nakamurella leprariae]